MRLIPLLAIVPVVLLTGCTPQAPTPTPTVTVTAPAPKPTDGEGSSRTAATPLDEWDAYLACRNLSIPYFSNADGGNDPGLVEFAAFEDSVIHARADGNFYAYIEVHNGNQEGALADNGAAQCIVGGGSLGGFTFFQMGATIRLTEAQIIEYQDQSLESNP